MRILMSIGICFISLIYSVNSAANNTKPSLFLNPQETINHQQQQICWFENKRYSEGAIIMMADVRVICTAKNPNHNNSALTWLMLNDKNEVIYPTATKKIRVH